MQIRNEDIKELIAEIPDGHVHMRITVVLHDGTEFTLNEATAANLVRAYVSVKTHPYNTKVRLIGKKVLQKKKGYADWQLLEEDTAG